MNIVEVSRKIGVVADDMLPKSSLPNVLLTLGMTARIPLDWLMRAHETLREGFFDETPSQRKIGVALRKRPNDMNMIGQYDEGVDVEGVSDFDTAQGVLEESNGLSVVENGSPSVGHDGEKVAGSGNLGATISHGSAREMLGRA